MLIEELLSEVMSRRGFLGGAAATAAVGAAGRAQATPFERNASGQMLTQVTIGGQGPFRFILDTGANSTVISSRIASQLNLRPVETGETVVGNEGRSQAQRVVLTNVQVGGVQRDQINAIVFPSNQFDAGTHGILGADSFSGQRILFDIRNRQYHLGPSGDPPENFTVVQGEIRRRHILFVTVGIEGHQIVSMVDTGAEMTFVNPTLMQLAGLPTIREVMNRDSSDRNATREVITAIPSIDFGSFRTGRVEAHGTTLPIYRSREGQETAGMLLGMNIWQDYSQVAIDYERAQLQVAR